ncbi:type II secretion system F family protein [Corynebacterium sp. Marseille-P4321]|uniref:type II secretion system F family protein n=1 Tax=Corynebacterium sp. Marseille-P4321 TaxID=2736603 RepID=UPI001588906F|nr:type II secretion system F family protein [Corynebacterium sp. Marseille-P4321]
MSPLFAVAAALSAAVTAPPPARRATVAEVRPPNAGVIPLLVGPVVLAALVFDRASLVLAFASAAATALHQFELRRREKADARRGEAAAALLGHLAAGMEAGLTLPQALERCAQQLPEDAPRELARDAAHMAHQARGGESFDAATPELSRVATLIGVSSRYGVPAASLVAAARDELDHARRHRAATTASLAGPRTTALVLAALPLAGIAMGVAMGANPVGFLTGGGVGGVLLVVGTALVCAGVEVSGQIIRRATR